MTSEQLKLLFDILETRRVWSPGSVKKIVLDVLSGARTSVNRQR